MDNIRSYLRSKAGRLVVQLPDWDDEKLWVRHEYMDHKVLSEAGITALRNAIREEQRQRREVGLVYYTIMIGVIGALTGLVSVLIPLLEKWIDRK